MILLLLLPLGYYLICQKLHNRITERPLRMVSALLVFEGLILFSVNLLSLFSALTPLTAAMFWLLTDLFLLTFPRGKEDRGILLPSLKHFLSGLLSKLKKIPSRLKNLWLSCSLMERLLLVLCILLCLLLLPIACLTVPYNYDSMTYHLARIAHWMDNGSVNYYLTNIDRQLYSPVLAEYNMLTMYLLSGTDTLLVLHQYASMLLTAYLFYVILRHLQVSRTFSLFGVFLFLSMPLTMSQAITTQNDLSATLWYAVFLLYLLHFSDMSAIQKTPSRQALFFSLCLGLTVGFAFLMKTSVCASLVMFLPWVLIVCIRRRDSAAGLVKLALSAFVSLLAVISETLIRTFLSTGALVSSATGGNIMVATKNAAYILVNIMKNFSLLITQHLWTGLNGFIYRLAISAGRLLHVEVNNIAIAFHGFDFITYLNTGDDMYSHDRTSSAFAAYFALLGGILLIVYGIGNLIRIAAKKDSKTDASFRPGFVVSAWLGFGFIMALLRWQPWGSRLLYPALSVAAIASVYMLHHFFQNKSKIVSDILLFCLTGLALLLAVKPLSDNSEVAFSYLAEGCDPGVREEQMFKSHSSCYASYQELLQQLERTQPKDIGLIISGDGYDYPIWKMLKERMPEAKIRHIIADDAAMQVTDADPATPPDCILWIERGRLNIGDHLQYFDMVYTVGFVSDAEGAPDSILYPDLVASDRTPDVLNAND